MKLEGMKIDFLGDSITEGAGTSGPEKVFHQVMKEKYNLKAAYNYGVSGTRIARQRTPSEWTLCDLDFKLRAEVMNRDVDAIVVFGGTNDFGHGDAPMGEIDSEDIYTFCGGLNSLIKTFKKDFAGVQIVFMTPLHRTEEAEPSKPDGKILKDYADAIIEICAKHGVPVIDLFKINPLDAWDAALLPDGLHPSDEGHVILADVVAAELMKI